MSRLRLRFPHSVLSGHFQSSPPVLTLPDRIPLCLSNLYSPEQSLPPPESGRRLLPCFHHSLPESSLLSVLPLPLLFSFSFSYPPFSLRGYAGAGGPCIHLRIFAALIASFAYSACFADFGDFAHPSSAQLAHSRLKTHCQYVVHHAVQTGSCIAFSPFPASGS